MELFGKEWGLHGAITGMLLGLVGLLIYRGARWLLLRMR